ncbi:hypothetical protein Tco_1185949 [Tanacetum coccineum]
MSNRHQELTSPEQTATGKDFSNPLIVDSLLKTIWSSMHHVFNNEALASPKQTAIGKDLSNPFIVDSLLKTIWLSLHHVLLMKQWLVQSKRLLSSYLHTRSYPTLYLTVILMASLDFCDKHNMVAFLEKSTGSAGFHQIIDFLNQSHICYALTKKPEVCISFIKQFWRSAEASNGDNGKVKINAIIDGHSLSITEGSLRRHLKLADQDGITSIPTTEIFEQLALMGYHTDSDKLTFQKGAFSPQWRFLIHNILHCLSPKKTAWEQFSSNIATATICLATNRKFNFSRMIFEHMVSNISSPYKFLMYPRFIQICLDMQRHHLQQHLRIYQVPSLTMKVFSNMKRSTKGFLGHLKLQELVNLVTTLSDKIGVLEADLMKTKKTYSSAYTKLILRVKKLEAQINVGKAKRQTRVVLSDTEVKASDEVSTVGAKKDTASVEVPTVSTAEVHLSTAGGTVTYSRRSAEKRSRQDKGKSIMTEEEPKKKSKKELEQERLSYAEAIRLEEQMNEEQRAQIARDEEIARQWDEEERKRAMDEAKSTKKIDWNDPSVIRYHTQKMKPKTIAQARRNMIKYLKNQGNYKITDFKGMSYNDIRPIFEKVWDFNQNIVPMDAEHGSEKQESPAKEKSSEKVMEEEIGTQEELKQDVIEPVAKRKKSIPRKTTRKRQKLEEDAEKDEIKGFLDIVLREEAPIEVEYISTKFPIVDWKICVLTETFMYYQVLRGDGSSKNYKVLSEMLEDFDRLDVEELFRLVKERYSTSRPKGFDLMLWGDLHTLFEPSEDDEIWRDQHEYNLLSWRLCDFCGIHILLMDNGLAIHMLTEKKYPLSQGLLTKMLSRKLEVDHESSQAFELLRIDQGVGSTSGIRACALRNFDLGKMELENSQNNALAKLPMLKLGEYEMWEIRIKQYFQIQDYALWEVIENGNSWVPIPVTAPESGPSTALKMTVPSTTEEKICKKNDVKARSLLLMALPNEHQLTFNQYADAQSMFIAIKARFGGNDATKKTQKALLKQQYENFNATSSESLDSIFNRLQKLVSRLAILGVDTSPEDLNVKFLRSLPSEWDTHVVVWMNKPDFETMGLDDLYNNFKIVEQKVKRTVAVNNDDKNLAFLTTTSPSSTNSINTANTGVSTGNSKVNTASAETSTASFSDATAYAFLSSQPQGSQLVHEDLEQIHDDDLEEMDLKWNMALLSMRARKFYQRTGRKIVIDGSSTAGYDKSKVECFKNSPSPYLISENDNLTLKFVNLNF